MMRLTWRTLPLSCVVVLLLVEFQSASRASRPSRARNAYTTHNELEPSTDELNASTLDSKIPRRVDPQGSWLSFVRHSEGTSKQRHRATKHSNKNSRGKLRKKQKNLSMLHYEQEYSRVPGPIGPPGPQGPQGPAGAQVTVDVIMREFKDLIIAEAEKRAESLMTEKCPHCQYVQNTSGMSLLDTDSLLSIPRISAGFHQRIKANVVVHRKTRLELKHFHMPFGGGAFQRGEVFNPEEGRFTAPLEGVYQLSVNLHIAHEFNSRKKSMQRKLKRRDNVRVLICIQSLCQKHTSLEFVSGLESNSRTFTISVSGLLHLEGSQYASIFVDNSASLPITVLEGSDFSGILVGI